MQAVVDEVAGSERAVARVGAAEAVGRASVRFEFVDWFRGLLIAHMALDHASLMFNAGRGGEELWNEAPAPPLDLGQFLTRFSGVPVATGFCFMAGFMVAVTGGARAERGVPESEVSRRLVVRGLVLLAVDALVLGLPRAANGFYSFMVLSCIGVSLIALAALRRLPTRLLLPLTLVMLLFHPLLEVSDWPVWLRAIVHEPVRSGAFRSLYPLVPWSGVVLLGFLVGRDAQGRAAPERRWLAFGIAALALFVVVRTAGGFGNAYPTGPVASYAFWSFSKYPPDVPFTSLGLGVVFLALAALRRVGPRASRLLQPFAAFGRVPFFFYVVHFYVLGLAMALIHRKFLLPGTFAVWAALLVVMWLPCRWYFRKKTERPNWFTRYV